MSQRRNAVESLSEPAEEADADYTDWEGPTQHRRQHPYVDTGCAVMFYPHPVGPNSVTSPILATQLSILTSA